MHVLPLIAGHHNGNVKTFKQAMEWWVDKMAAIKRLDQDTRGPLFADAILVSCMAYAGLPLTQFVAMSKTARTKLVNAGHECTCVCGFLVTYMLPCTTHWQSCR